MNPLLGLGLLLAFALACNFSATTANISDLKVGKDKDVSQPTTSFDTNDTIYAVATISNVPGKVKVTGRLLIEDVEGHQAGPTGLEKTLDLPGSGTANFTFTPMPAGWPKGKYKVEVVLLDEDGKQQQDQKATSVTVSE